MKRIFSAILAVVLLAGTTVFASAKASNTAIDDSVAEITAEQEKLPKPTDLKWHYAYNQGKEMFGWIAWKKLDSKYDNLYMYSLRIYRDGVEIYNTNMSSGVVNGYVGTNIGNQGIFTQSGEYKFAVAARPYNPNGDYTQSDFAESEVYKYTLPEKKAVAVKKVSVNSDYSKLSFPTNDANSYSVVVEYTTAGSDTRFKFRTMTEYKNGKSEIKVDIADVIAEIVRNYDAEKIYIGVKASSPDPLTCQDSEIVWLSSPYIVPVDYFGKKLAELVEKYGIDNHSANINDLITELDAYIAQTGITKDDIRYSFECRNDVVNHYVKISAPYSNINVTFPGVRDDSNGYFDDIGMNLNITDEYGYNSNVTETGICFSTAPGTTIPYMVLSKPEYSNKPSDTLYMNTKGLHIDFEGVVNPDSLKYPVPISLPLPAGIDTTFYGTVTVLKDDGNGSFTSIACSTGTSWSQNSGEVKTISFVIDGAGDYYIANYNSESPYDFDYDGKITADDVAEFIDTIIEFALKGWLGETSDNPYDINNDNSFDAKDLNDLMKTLREAIGAK